MKSFKRLLAPTILAIGLGSTANAALIHDYQLNGSLADALGGPSLVPINAGGPDGTIGATGFTFPFNSGLQLSNGLPTPDNYSIEITFSFDQTTGYRRIIDFKDRATDNGLYNLSGAINFFPFTTGAGIFSPGGTVNIIVTRDGTTNAFNVYAGGANVLSLADGGGNAEFTAANNVINFFRDDLAFQNEASSGFVDLIRVYDAPLSAVDARCLQVNTPVACGVSTGVPEPATLGLIGLGLAAFGFASRRKS